MAGMESSPVPVEPAKTHAARVGRGGVGNYLEAKKWENSIPAATKTKTGTGTGTGTMEVPVKLDTLVLPLYPPLPPIHHPPPLSATLLSPSLRSLRSTSPIPTRTTHPPPPSLS